VNEAHSHYLGKRINVEVGQLLIVAFFLWDATAQSKQPCFVEMQFQSTLGLNISGKSFVPQVSNKKTMFVLKGYSKILISVKGSVP
jgi:hypothetical protein